MDFKERKNLFHTDTSTQLRLLQMPSLKIVRDLKMVKDYIRVLNGA